MLGGRIRLVSQPETSSLPCDDVYNAGFGGTPALSLENVAIDSRLEIMLEVREGIEAEIEEPFAIAVSDGTWEKVANEALFVARVRAARTEHGLKTVGQGSII